MNQNDPSATGTPEELQKRIEELERQLRHAQQMEALGTLAGGIAHDFNNILSVIIGFSDLSRDDTEPDSLARENLEQILKAGYRARELVNQILTFSRQTEQEKTPLQIHLVIKEALRLLQATIPSTIELRHNIDKTSGAVLADPTQIYQVIMNLCTNAYQAMKVRGGVLDVSLDSCTVDEDLAAQIDGLEPGSYVRLTTHDTGPGMEPEILEHIFESGFTTKPDSGTGLGLSIVSSIISHSKGTISVESEPGKGTTFTIYLPRIDQAPAFETEKAATAQEGNERVLFVDDEASLVNAVMQMLERLGYQATGLTSSAEALERIKEDAYQFDLIITDEIMPNMTGSELTREILRIRPDMPIVLTTGFVEPASDKHVQAAGFRDCIMKPFVTRDLARTIQNVLGPTDPAQ